MKIIIAVIIVILVVVLGFGTYQNIQNNPKRGCTRVDSADKYWRWDCKDGNSFYEAK